MAKKLSTTKPKRLRPDPSGAGQKSPTASIPGRKRGPVLNVAPVPDGFPDRLREAREALGWSQAKLARNSGIDKRSAGRYELGLVAPSIQVAAKLAIALGKSLDHMAGLGPSSSDPAVSPLLAKLQQLPPDRKELVKALINVLSEKK